MTRTLNHQGLWGLILLMISTPCFALSIQLYDTGGAAVGTPAGNSFRYAADIWERTLHDDAVIRIQVGFSQLNDNVLGQAQSFTQAAPYSDVRQALNSDIQSLNDQSSAQTLPEHLAFLTNDPQGALSVDDDGSANNRILNVARSNLKALGLLQDDGAMDAQITFNTHYPFDFNRQDGVSNSLFDFTGIALHEIGHALGFSSGVDILDYYSAKGPGSHDVEDFNPYPLFSVLDLFRYSERSQETGGPGTRDLAIGDANPYLSIDGGQTALARLSSGVYNGDEKQASHWKSLQNLGLMSPSASRGALGDLSQYDLTALDIIGYDLRNLQHVSIPLPGTFWLFLFALIAFIFFTHSKKGLYEPGITFRAV